MAAGADTNGPMPAAKRRRISPTQIQTEEGIEKKGREKDNTETIRVVNCMYLTRNQIIEGQIAEADSHQYAVDNGICWQRDFYWAPILEDSPIANSDLPRETLELLTWTGPQKASFIELIGRKTESALPEISKIIGKSVIECQAYLEILQQESARRMAIDYAEIPAAEEVPDHLVEPDLAVNIDLLTASDSVAGQSSERTTDNEETVDNEGTLDSEKATDSERSESDNKLFVVKRLNRLAQKQISPGSAVYLRNMLRQRLFSWIVMISRQHAVLNSASVSRELVEYVINMEAEGLKIPREQLDTKLSQMDYESRKEVEEEDIREDESKELKLIDDETNWLDRMDWLNSIMDLQSRGVSTEGLSVSPPGMRDADLEKFMQSR